MHYIYLAHEVGFSTDNSSNISLKYALLLCGLSSRPSKTGFISIYLPLNLKCSYGLVCNNII